MIITQSKTIGGAEMSVEVGKLALQAEGACVLTLGETQVLATCTSSNPREGIDFFPLTVDVEERMYAAGKIPGGFFRREGRPSETAILTARLIDRPLRPTFADGYRDEVQVVITVLSADLANPYDIPGINAAGLAVTLAGLPFDGPVAGVRAGLIGGQWKINPTYQDLELATFDVVVAGRMNDLGQIDILMVEGEAPEGTWERLQSGDGSAPTEEIVAEGLEVAKAAIGEIIVVPARHRGAGRRDAERVHAPSAVFRGDVVGGRVLRRPEARRRAGPRAAGARGEPGRAEERPQGARAVGVGRGDLRRARERDRPGLQGPPEEGHAQEDRRGRRPAGRPHAATRSGRCLPRSDLIPRAHGSGLFQRGETQVLNVATLGMLRMTQMIDTLDPEESKRYIHHYNFPPFSTGETGRIGSPRRREIGHGALAERALVPVIPDEDEFPYTLRLVSDVLSSNGSTSMASVCASTLSLMDAGVPIKAPVAGIAMGLIADRGQFVTLTDILGAEDALGDMDFKVAGTTDFVTAIQLDMKVTGLPQEVLAGALKQAKDARLFILDTIAKTLPGPRAALSAKAPRVVMIQIPVDKIGEVIGPKGKRINEISAMTGADINIEDDGRVFVGSREGAGAEEAIDMIEQIVNPRLPEVGERFEGTVVKTTEFGAFVSITPVRDGLVHISKLGRGKRLSSVEEAVKTGDKLTVEVESIDLERGRIALKPVGEGWDPPEGGWPRVEGDDGDRGERRPRSDRDRRPRDRDRGGRGRREGGGERHES